MASFWKNNPSVPTWSDLVKDWFNGQPSKLIDSTPPMRPLPQGIFIRKAIQEDLEQLPEFWSRWYSVKAARCMVPISHIMKMAQGDIFVCINPVGEVIGSIVRRWITGLHMREVRWPRAAMIDYFCIHPAHRKKGLGRALLTFLHNSTLYTEKVILPHLMLWEGVQPTIPPASVGFFLHRKCFPKGPTVAIEQGAELWAELWKTMQRGKDIWNESCEAQGETSIWTVGPCPSKPLAIWNTFHRSVPEGLLIGIVVGGDTDTANAFAQAIGHPFGILLMAGNPLGSEGWTLDSPYQWISYNTKMNFISYQFPGIFL
jgi:GNAT superfamily N-acetyltransferase